MSEALMIKSLYNMEETIAAGIFEGKTYPWEVLPEIKTFIITLGESLQSQHLGTVSLYLIGELAACATPVNAFVAAVPIQLYKRLHKEHTESGSKDHQQGETYDDALSRLYQCG